MVSVIIKYLFYKIPIIFITAPCTESISTTGFSPCLTCQKGSYRSDSLTCQSCGFGQTTNGDGATSPDACVSSTIDDGKL
jgi:hypothetical protein